MKKALRFYVIFSVLALFATSSFSQPFVGKLRGKGLRERSHVQIYHILKAKQKELKVTDDQLEEIKNIVFSSEEKMIAMIAEIGKSRLELKKILLNEGKKDEHKIRAALSKSSDIRNDIFIERLKTREQVQNILTAEQKDALKAMRQEGLRGRRELGRRPFKQRLPRFRDRMRE